MRQARDGENASKGKLREKQSMIYLLILSIIALFWFIAAAVMSERESKVDRV